MERVSKKFGNGLYQRWCDSSVYDISQAYSRPSYKKMEAWQYCKDLRDKYEGWDLRIVSYNTFVFTAGFICPGPDGERVYVHITPSHDYCMIIG